MYNASLHMFCGGMLSTSDGRLTPYGLPEPLFLRRRIETLELLDRFRREDRQRKREQRAAARAEALGHTGTPRNSPA